MDLGTVYRACARPTFAQAQRLLEAGISPEIIAIRDLVRVGRITSIGRLFDLTEDGRPSWITPIRGLPDGEIEHPRPAAAIDELPILDLVAWSLSRPIEWALVRGAVSIGGLVEPQYLEPAPVKIHRTVVEWLTNRTDGVVFLTDDQRERGEMLRRFAVVSAYDERHCSELRAEASRPWPVPKFVLRCARRREAA